MIHVEREGFQGLFWQQCRCSRWNIGHSPPGLRDKFIYHTLYASKNMSCFISLDRDCIPKSGSNCCLPPRKFPPLENNCDDSYPTSNIRPRLRLFHPWIPDIFVPGEKFETKPCWISCQYGIVNSRPRVTLSLTRKDKTQILPNLLSMNVSNSSLAPLNCLIEGKEINIS